MGKFTSRDLPHLRPFPVHCCNDFCFKGGTSELRCRKQVPGTSVIVVRWTEGKLVESVQIYTSFHLFYAQVVDLCRSLSSTHQDPLSLFLIIVFHFCQKKKCQFHHSPVSFSSPMLSCLD